MTMNGNNIPSFAKEFILSLCTVIMGMQDMILTAHVYVIQM